MNAPFSRDFFDLAARDLKHAETSMHAHMHELACISARHSVENALRGLFQTLSADSSSRTGSWGFSIRKLLEHMEKYLIVGEDLRSALTDFEQYYIEGEDMEWISLSMFEIDSHVAIQNARTILEFCRNYRAVS